MGISINIGGGGSRYGGFGRRRRYGRRRQATPLGTMIGGIIVVLFGGGFYFVDQHSAAQTKEILENGVVAEAQVYDHDRERRVRYDDEGRRRERTRHYVWLRFTDENGQEQTVERKRVNRGIFNAASRDRTITVAYLPNDPGSIAFPAHESGEANPWIGFLIGIIGLLLAGFGFFQMRRQGSQAQDEGEGEPELREQDESQEV